MKPELVRHSTALDLITAGPTDTEALACRIGAWARDHGAGTGIALSGELGAGKTVFVRGLARGLAIEDPESVHSPSYLMMVEHQGPVPLLHVDAYFADKGARILEEGGLEAFPTDGLTVVEWPERLPFGLPVDWLRVRIEPVGESLRRLHLEASGTWQGCLAVLACGEEPLDSSARGADEE